MTLWYCACICVCVCVKVGLAVGDTAEEKDKATFTRTRLQVEFILELEAMSIFLRGQMRPPDNRRRYFKKVGHGMINVSRMCVGSGKPEQNVETIRHPDIKKMFVGLGHSAWKT